MLQTNKLWREFVPSAAFWSSLWILERAVAGTSYDPNSITFEFGYYTHCGARGGDALNKGVVSVLHLHT
jgi:hypothetical protein